MLPVWLIVALRSGLWCGDKHTTVNSLTSGYFEMKLAFCGNFWLFKKFYRDKG